MAKEIKISKLILDPLERVTHFLQKKKIPYAVMGGIALQAWGRERSTKDIDLVISVDEIETTEFLQELDKLELIIVHSDKEIGQFGLIETEYVSPKVGIPIGVDFFIARTQYQKQVLTRPILVNVLGLEVRLMSAEDLILNKLLSRRPLDLSDVRNIIAEQKDLLDKPYLSHWAKRLGVSRRLESLMKDTGLSS